MDRLTESTIRDAAVKGFGAAALSIRRVRHGVSAIYHCETLDNGPCYLRFTHEALIPRCACEANAAYLEHLAREGAPVSELVRPRGGGTVLAVPQGGEPFLATAVQEVPGRTLDSDDCSPEIFREWGRAMARLHRAAESFEPADPGAYLEEDAHWLEALERIPEDDALARAEWQALHVWWNETARPLGDRGLTHADMNATNAVWDDGRVHLIDFDEPIWHVFASDLARPFREMEHHRAAERAAAKAALLEGYRSERRLAAEWDDALPWLVRMKQLEMYASAVSSPGWHGSVLADGVRREDFIAERRRAFERYARRR